MGRVISTALQFIDGFTKPSKQVIDSMKKMGGEITKAGKQIQNAGKTITTAGKTMTTGITLPITGIATAAIKTAADFESAMSQVGAIAGTVADEEIPEIIQQAKEMGLSFKEGASATETAMNILGAKAKEMGAKTKFSASESAEAMNYMAMAGWKTSDMIGGIEGIMNLAAASGEDLATTSDIVTDALTAFGMTAQDSSRFADVLAAASSNANTNVSMMGETFKYCAPVAGALGYSVEDTAEAIGLMANSGIKASNAGTAMRAMLTNLQGAVEFSGDSFGKWIVETTNADGSMRGLNEILADCRAAFSHMTESEKAANAEAIVGKTGMSGFLAVMNAAPADIEKLNGAITNSAGAAEKMAEVMNNNLNGQITILKSAIEGITISIGDKLLPYIKKAVSWFQTAAEYINHLSAAQMDHIIKWTGVAAAIGPAVMAFGKVVTTIGSVTKTYGTFVKKIGNFNGIAKMLTSPAGIVIGVLAGIAAAAILIIKNWDKIQSFLSRVGGWFKNTFEKAGFSVEEFKSKFSSIGNSIGNIADKIGGFCKSIAGVFRNEFAGVVTEGAVGINKGLGTIFSGAGIAFDGILTGVDVGTKALSGLVDFFSGAFQGNWDSAAQKVRDSLKNIFPENIANGFITAFDKTLPVIKGVIEGVKATFGGLIQDVKLIFENIKSIFGGIGTVFKGIFTGDIEGAFRGFKTAVGGVLDVVANLFRLKITAIKNFVFVALSNLLPQEIINKITKAFDVVAAGWSIAITAAKDLANGLIEGIRPVLENMKTILNGVSQFAKGIFTGDWKGALDGLKSITSGALSGLVNLIKAPFIAISSMINGVIQNFKGLEIVKKIFSSIGNKIKNVLSKSGVDLNQFGVTINSIKTRIGSIIHNLRILFGTAFGAIGSVIKAAAHIVANFFGKKIHTTCEEARTTIITFRTIIGATFQAISSVIKMTMGIIVPVVKVAFSSIKGVISVAIHTIASLINGFLTTLDGITTFVSGVFTGNWSKAWEGVKTIFKGVFESLVALCKVPINGVIGLINNAISGINQLGLTIPEWVPGIGGKSFSINVPTIPMLYKGTDNWQGGAAIIHDKGGEIVDLPKGTRVYPHDKSVEMARKEGASQNRSITINIQKLADKLEVRSEEDIDHIAEALARKLKQVAFNTGSA